MAKTKKELYVLNGGGGLASATDVLGNNAGLTATYLGVTQDNTGTTGDFDEEVYADATAQAITVVRGDVDITVAANQGDDVPFAGGMDISVTIIDVTGGREKFPRKSFTGKNLGELVSAINGKEVFVGDGKLLTCVLNDLTAEDATGIVITAAENQVIRVAVSDEMEATITEAPYSFSKGYTAAEAAEFVKNMATQIYGRTNRVGFPIVEPDFTEYLTSVNYSLAVFTKYTTRMDKNFGAGYVDEEKIYLLHNITAQGASDAVSLSTMTV